MTFVEMGNILKQMDANVMVNMALYLSGDISRMSTPIDQILDLSKDYEYKCTSSPKFCLGFAYAYGYRSFYKKVIENPNEMVHPETETYPDYDRVIMDDCFREYIRRRTLIIHEKQFADQGFSQEVHQKCYEVLYGELKEELLWLQQLIDANEQATFFRNNIIMLVRRLKSFVEIELPMQDSDSSKLVSQKLCEKSKLDESTLEEDNFEDLKKIVPSEKWEDIEKIHKESCYHMSRPSEAASWVRMKQEKGQIMKAIPPKKIYDALSKTIEGFELKYESFSRELRRK